MVVLITFLTLKRSDFYGLRGYENPCFKYCAPNLNRNRKLVFPS